MRLLVTVVICVAVAAGAAAQDEPPAAQDEPPAVAPDEAPAGERQPRRIQIDLKQVLAQARQAVRAGDLQRAIGLYQFVLRFAPNLKVARVELSFALARLGERERAARLLRDLDTEGFAPEVLDLIGRIVRPDRLSFFLVPEFFLDSNLTRQSQDEIIFIGGLPFRLSEEARARPGYGYGVTVGANYRLIDRNPRTTLTTGVTIRDFERGKDDQQNFFSALSFRINRGRFGLISSVSGAYRYRNWEPREAEFGAGLAVPMDLRPVRNTLGVRYRKIADEIDLNGRLDRKVYEVYDIVSFGFAGIGFRLDQRHVRADWLETDTQDNWQLESGLDMTFAKVPWIVPTVGGSFTYRDFKNPAAFFNVERRDREYEGHIELLFSEWKLFDSRPFIRYEYTKSTSNIALFEFDRHEVSFGVRVITF